MVKLYYLFLIGSALMPIQSFTMHRAFAVRMAQSEKCAKCGIADPKRFSGCNFQKILGFKNFQATFFKKNLSAINGLKKEIYVYNFDDAVRALKKNQFSTIIEKDSPHFMLASFTDCQGTLCHVFAGKR